MKRIRKFIFFLLFIGITFSLQGCFITDFLEELFDPSLMIIRGSEVISGEGNVLEIKPGTTVKIKSKEIFGIVDSTSDQGQLVFADEAKLIAQGTKELPIIFESEGWAKIVFREDSDGLNSIIEYCKFDNIRLEIENSITIKYLKFINDSNIELYKNSESLIQSNSFESLYNNSSAICGKSDILWQSDICPTIKYNYFDGYEEAIVLYDNWDKSPIIENNNILNTEYYAIVADEKVIVNNNYVYNCNGKSGADTTGEQVHILGTYTNPQTTQINNAGCGW